MIGIEIQNLKSVQRAFNEGESIFAQGLWRGTSRSLGAFRRDFLKHSPPIKRGVTKRQAASGPGSNAMPPLARGFRYEVNPKKPQGIKQGTGLHAKKSASVNGNFGTTSTAAESLEKGGTITPKGKWLGIPIVEGSSAVNAQRIRKGEQKPRAKRGWRKVRDIVKKRKYVTTFEKTGNRIIVFVRDRKNPEAKPTAVMLLVKRIQMRPVLNLFDLWNAYTPEILIRFDKEMKAAVADTYKRMRK